MYRQLLKHLLAYSLLTLICNTSFAQFIEINPREGRLKGKVDSVLFLNFKFSKTATGELREFNDKCIYFYNSKGLLIKEYFSDYEGNEPGPFISVYSYDDKGNWSEALSYKRKGVLKGKAFYTFDPVKRIVEVRNVRTVTGKILLDEAGNILEDITYHDYPTPFTTVNYKYDEDGCRIESVQSWSKSPDVQKTTYTYDKDHNLIKETIINNGSLLSSYTYSYPKYDNMHNWLIQNIYEDGHQAWVTERKIAYK